jgi:hypothetical protein
MRGKPCPSNYYYDPETEQYYSGAGSYFDEPCNPMESRLSIRFLGEQTRYPKEENLTLMVIGVLIGLYYIL